MLWIKLMSISHEIALRRMPNAVEHLQHWFKWQHQAVSGANVDPDLCWHMTSLDHSESIQIMCWHNFRRNRTEFNNRYRGCHYNRYHGCHYYKLCEILSSTKQCLVNFCHYLLWWYCYGLLHCYWWYLYMKWEIYNCFDLWSPVTRHQYDICNYL